MLKIHKLHSKLLLIPITSILSIGVLLGLYGLTYTPELSHAETVTYPEKETRDMSQITYMQEITPEICTNTPEADTNGNNQYQLKDSRDQKVYWVAKLKDGNCWMTQNLALDLSASKSLTSELTDIAAEVGSWRPTNNTQTTPSGLSDTADVVWSYNPGSYIYTTPTTQNACAKNSTGLSACVGNGWRKTNGLEPSADANFYKNNRNQVIANNMYDAHYLSGNYYSWPAATAGSGNAVGVVDGVNAISSICPSGWRLPISGDNTGSKTFDYLFAQYGVDSNLTQGVYDIRLSPLHFVYSGYISFSYAYYDAILVDMGAIGRYWSSTAQNVSNAYGPILSFKVYSSNPNYRFYGNSVRCVTRTEVSNNVEITVNNTITLEVDSEIEVEKSDINPSTATLPVSVASNQPYSVSISSANPNLTSFTTSTTIPSVSGNLSSSTNAWGIKLSSKSAYTQITSTPITFYTATGAEVKTIPFTIGISTSPDLPNGEYSTDITITAAQN